MMQNMSGNHHITYAIFEQTRHEDSLAYNETVMVNRDDVIYKRIDPEYSDGCVWARYINLLNVDEEYDFFYQIDSHILHDKNWDRSLIEDWKRARDLTNSNKVIITGSCKGFSISEEDGEIKTFLHNPDVNTTTEVKYYKFEPDGSYMPGAHGSPVPATEMPKQGFHILAGNFFTHVDWVDQVGLDPRIYFEGEEVMMALQSYEKGYKIFHHTKTVSYHLEDTTNWHTKQTVDPVVNLERREKRAAKGRMVFRNYIDNAREDMLQDFYEEFGVDFINFKIDDRARCDNPNKNDSVPDASKDINTQEELPEPLFIEKDES
jgi:hypothetical protein